MGVRFYRIEAGDGATPLTTGEGQGVGRGERVLLLPSEQILLIEAELPRPLSRQLARQAAPNIVEDFLSEDPADLHFAYPAQAPLGTRMPMAVCAPVVLRDWLACCDPLPDHAIPDVLALPLHAEGWTLYLEPDRCLIRTGPFAGQAVDRPNLGLMLEALAQALEPPATLHLYGDPELAGDDLNGYRLETHPDTLVERLSYQPDQAIDLLQGPFRPRHSLHQGLRPWLPVAGILLLWWLAVTLDTVLNLHQLRQENQAAEALLEESFNRLMPKGTRSVNPRVQAERYLAEARNAGPASPLLPILAVVGPALSASGETKVERLDYRNQALEIQIQSKELQQPERMVETLNGKGVKAQLKQVNLDQGVATAILGLSLGAEPQP
jgi:general secretion pathway protein L